MTPPLICCSRNSGCGAPPASCRTTCSIATYDQASCGPPATRSALRRAGRTCGARRRGGFAGLFAQQSLDLLAIHDFSLLQRGRQGIERRAARRQYVARALLALLDQPAHLRIDGARGVLAEIALLSAHDTEKGELLP